MLKQAQQLAWDQGGYSELLRGIEEWDALSFQHKTYEPQYIHEHTARIDDSSKTIAQRRKTET